MRDELSALVWVNGEYVRLTGDEVREAMRTNTLPARLETGVTPQEVTPATSPSREKLMGALEGRGFAREVPFRGQNGRRRFAFDAAHEGLRVAVDYHGFGSGAAHTYRKKKAGDADKLNEAQLCGWIYFVCDAITVNAGRCLDQVDAAIAMRRKAE